MLACTIVIGQRVSRATVFNALDDLTAAGIVMRAVAGPGAVRYELATQAHHHFVCSRCGAVADVPQTSTPALAITPTGIEGVVEDTQVVYRGVCASCLVVSEAAGDT